MFFGNMQSYYRRNSYHNQPHGSQTRVPKGEQVKRVKNLSKNESGDNEETLTEIPMRRKSFSISRNPDSEEQVEELKSGNVPVIKIGLYERETKEYVTPLKRKSCRDPDDNSERLGPNKNNIIEETLRMERRKSAEWNQQ